MSESRHGDFAEGEDDPGMYPGDKDVGRFSKGQEELADDDPEKGHRSRFSEGEEELSDDPDEEGSYGESE